jgi:hypothetical protein
MLSKTKFKLSIRKLIKMLKKILLSSLVALFALKGFAQNDSLPFFIDPRKKMPTEELKYKKEGAFITGLPRVEYDPIRGFGAGGNLNFFINNDKNDPFFEYTPYRHRVNAEFFIFENGRVRYALNYDAPYIFNSKWRLRADAVLWEDPNAQYWGIGRRSLDQLRFRDKRTGLDRNFRRMSDYEDNLALAEFDGTYYRTDFHFNHFLQREQLYNLLGERTFWGGKGRFMFGYEMLFTSFQSYSGRIAEEAFTLDGERVDAFNNETLVDLEKAEGVWDRFNLDGFNNSSSYMFTSMLAAALIYDTRDFEPDPSKGVFLQYSHEYSAPWLGSQFDFNKFMVQGQVFQTLKRWNNGKGRLTFAGLGAFGYIFGPNINFIEMWDLSSQAEAGGILVLGGDRSIRGYREARFLAPTVALINLELRARFFDFKLLNQNFAFGLTPFFDMGSVWDSPTDISFSRWVGAPGLGGRLAWNQSTILRLDYAQSVEGSQFFFGFGHIF